MNVPTLAAALVSLLPSGLQARAKGIIGLLMSAASIASLLIPGVPAWVAVAVAVASAPAVYFTPNLGYADPAEKILGKASPGQV